MSRAGVDRRATRYRPVGRERRNMGAGVVDDPPPPASFFFHVFVVVSIRGSPPNFISKFELNVLLYNLINKASSLPHVTSSFTTKMTSCPRMIPAIPPHFSVSPPCFSCSSLINHAGIGSCPVNRCIHDGTCCKELEHLCIIHSPSSAIHLLDSGLYVGIER